MITMKDRGTFSTSENVLKSYFPTNWKNNKNLQRACRILHNSQKSRNAENISVALVSVLQHHTTWEIIQMMFFKLQVLKTKNHLNEVWIYLAEARRTENEPHSLCS